MSGHALVLYETHGVHTYTIKGVAVMGRVFLLKSFVANAQGQAMHMISHPGERAQSSKHSLHDILAILCWHISWH
jgi:hypothetical protein